MWTLAVQNSDELIYTISACSPFEPLEKCMDIFSRTFQVLEFSRTTPKLSRWHGNPDQTI